MGVSIVPALRALKTPLLIAAAAVLGLTFGYWVNGAYFTDLAPEQPIAFSHRVHAGEFEIPCQYCHTEAHRSTVAGVPSVERCVGCHEVVARDAPQIRRVIDDYWANRQPIPWIKVHDLPDFVHFTHKRHVLAGIQCQVCHGPVETMDRIRRVESLQMSWCLDCHRTHEVEHGLDCWTCHK